jgi:light-regulated signal transduction histidine kinase (bacteriophytochrome)
VHVLVSINAIRELAEEKLCMILTDLTDQKKMEEQLNRNIERLETANSDLQRFAYVASHDMKEPLRNITSCVQLLHKKMKTEVDAETQTLLGYLVDSNNRIVDLIDDLLRFSRIGTTGQPFKVIDSGLVIHDVLRRLSRLIVESNAEIIFKDLPHVSADWSQLSLVFQNLISNSIKFCSNKTPRIEISAAHEDCNWKFMVKDNGIGIEEPYYGKIFEIFQRLNGPKFSGTGIGLAIVKRIIERHGGKIWVKAKLGEGSTFYFTLPDRVPECEEQMEGVAATSIQSDFSVRTSKS